MSIHRYDGQFASGKRHGKGSLTCAEGSGEVSYVVRTDSFRSLRAPMKLCSWFPTMTELCGDTQAGIARAVALLSLSDGKEILSLASSQGEFVGGLKQGDGLQVYADCSTFQARWVSHACDRFSSFPIAPSEEVPLRDRALICPDAPISLCSCRASGRTG